MSPMLAIVLGLSIVMSFSPFYAEADSLEFPFHLGVIPSAPGDDYPVADAPRRVKVQSLPSVIDLSADLPPVGSQGERGSLEQIIVAAIIIVLGVPILLLVRSYLVAWILGRVYIAIVRDVCSGPRKK